LLEIGAKDRELDNVGCVLGDNHQETSMTCKNYSLKDPRS